MTDLGGYPADGITKEMKVYVKNRRLVDETETKEDAKSKKKHKETDAKCRKFMTKNDIHLVFYLDKVARREEMKVASFDFIDIGSKYRGFVPTKDDKLPAGYPSLPNFLEAVENARVTPNPYPEVGITKELKEYIKNRRSVDHIDKQGSGKDLPSRLVKQKKTMEKEMRKFIKKHDIHLIFYLDKVARREEMKDLNIDKICGEYQGFFVLKKSDLPKGFPSLPRFIGAVENAMVTLRPYPDKGITEEMKEYVKNRRVVEHYAAKREEKKFKMKFQKASKSCQEFQKNHDDVHLLFYLNKVARREDMKTFSLFEKDSMIEEIDKLYPGFIPDHDDLPDGFPSLKEFQLAIESARKNGKSQESRVKKREESRKQSAEVSQKTTFEQVFKPYPYDKALTQQMQFYVIKGRELEKALKGVDDREVQRCRDWMKQCKFELERAQKKKDVHLIFYLDMVAKGIAMEDAKRPINEEEYPGFILAPEAIPKGYPTLSAFLKAVEEKRKNLSEKKAPSNNDVVNSNKKTKGDDVEPTTKKEGSTGLKTSNKKSTSTSEKKKSKKTPTKKRKDLSQLDDN